MKANHLKMLIAGITVAGAAAFLGLTGLSKGWVYYLPVDEFVQNEKYQDQRVRLHGIVSEENLVLNPTELTATFDLKGETTIVRVAYTGVVPDQFQAEREVVVEGKLDETGVLCADTLMTKCASKYEQGDAPHSDPRMAENSQ